MGITRQEKQTRRKRMGINLQKNIEEHGLIGSLLVDEKKMLVAVEIVKPTDFIDERAAIVFSTMIDEWQQKRPIDLVTISRKIPNLATYLANTTQHAYSPAVKSLAESISNSARTRRVKAGVEASLKGPVTADEILSNVMHIYRSELRCGKKNPEIKSVISRVNQYTKKCKESGRFGINTGFDFYENLYIRFVPGQIWTIGGFTSVGKTATMVQFICNLLSGKENPSIVVVSTEMTEEQVAARIIANFTGVSSVRILSGNYRSEEEADSVERVKNRLAECRLLIYDDIYLLDDIETAYRKADLQGGVDVGFIDYVQNCRWPEARSQYQEQSTIAKRLQKLAKDVRSTLVCLSQVSNDVGRGNTDQLELKGAGEWAAVSDVSIMLQRKKSEKYKLRQVVKKNRHGQLGECYLEYKNDFTSIEQVDEPQQ